MYKHVSTITIQSSNTWRKQSCCILEWIHKDYTQMSIPSNKPALCSTIHVFYYEQKQYNNSTAHASRYGSTSNWKQCNYWSYQNIFAMFFCLYQINDHVHNVEICRRNVECVHLISACDVWYHTSHAVIKTTIVGKCKPNQSSLTSFKWLSISSDTHNWPQPHYKYQVCL